MGTASDTTFPTLGPANGSSGSAWDVAGVSRQGKGRTHNEDHFLIADLSRQLKLRATNIETRKRAPQTALAGQAMLLAVADGLGGHGAGELASATVLDAIAGDLLRSAPWPGEGDAESRHNLLAHLARAGVEVQQRLWTVASRRNAAPDLGSTLTCAYVTERHALVMHVGDSRAYLIADDGTPRRLTRDHTLAESLRDRGLESERFEHVLVNAIGGDQNEPRPELHEIELVPGDALVLASDGLTRSVEDMTIGKLVAGARADAACEALISAALAAGAQDDVTVVIARPRRA